MRKVKVITDSTADLPKEITEERGIDVVPLRIILGDKNYPDNGRLKPEELFEFAEETGTPPKTAAPGEHQFLEAFQKRLEEDYDVFFIGISGKLSRTVQNALAAAAKLVGGRISIADSLSLSCGLGLQVLEAADMADRGESLQEITARANILRPKIKFSVVLDTLKYSYIGGRCSWLTSALAGAMHVKATVGVKDGEMAQGETLRGWHYIDKFIEQAIGDPKRVDPKRIFVAQCLADDAAEVKKKLKSQYGFDNVIIAATSPTISVYCGPKALGIMYMSK